MTDQKMRTCRHCNANGSLNLVPTTTERYCETCGDYVEIDVCVFYCSSCQGLTTKVADSTGQE